MEEVREYYEKLKDYVEKGYKVFVYNTKDDSLTLVKKIALSHVQVNRRCYDDKEERYVERLQSFPTIAVYSEDDMWYFIYIW